MRYVNLGCGDHYHHDWINIDIAPRSAGVIACDVGMGIPLPDCCCAVVYHSNLLEHLRRQDALRFMRECYRVLEPGGVLRVAVPDLERICRTYLDQLEAVLAADRSSAGDYDWMMLELYDQTVREQSGGEMLTFLRQNTLANEQFVYGRIGEEGRALVKAIRDSASSQPGVPGRTPWVGCAGLRALLRRARRLPSDLRKGMLALLLGTGDLQALAIGRFRLAGEVHHWMYDRYSLARLMLAAGFRDPTVQSAYQSRVPNWCGFDLDTTPGGIVYKPDSLFMECMKPSGA